MSGSTQGIGAGSGDTGSGGFENRYGLIDRLLHGFAFRFPGILSRIAAGEARRYKDELTAFQPGPPVLITGLPRSGTTILLELLAGMSPFAAHTYRDVPFVLCPMTCHRFQKADKAEAARERAHGDGILIDLDSPEAFEEMVWMRFFPKAYPGPCIQPWQRCDDEAFRKFYRGHRRRIIALRRRQDPTRTRYVAKNNLLISRLTCIGEAVPDATILLPFRDPLQHAASLLRQHERFLAMHSGDPFARRYMAGIGHFDFGANLKPIDFGGWWSQRQREPDAPRTLGFWIEYWIAAYQHVLQHVRTHGAAGGIPICFEQLNASADLGPLGAALQLEDGAALQARAPMLRAPSNRPVDADSVDRSLMESAQDTYRHLQQLALKLA